MLLQPLLVALALLGADVPASPAPRPLTFGQRVDAQRAIERVYHAHQIGASIPFEKAVPQAVLEKKVRTYLKQSAALETLWGTPITAAMLRAELDRIRRSTRLPQRLTEIFSALGDDPFLIQETFVRAALAGRLTRSFFDGDARFQDGTGRHEPWGSWWARAQGDFDAASVEPVASAGEPLDLAEPAAAGAACRTDVWDNGSLDDLPDPRPNATAVWTGTVAIFWGGGDYEEVNFYDGASYNTGGRYDPLTDSWSQVSTRNAPSHRFEHTAVWTGSEMIVWGGFGVLGGWFLDELGDGARYDPVSDTWTPLPVDGAPEPRGRHSAVWTGSSMIVWGGARGPEYGLMEVLNTGAQYIPASNTWTPVTTLGAPAARLDHAAVWTGSEMVVVGGPDGCCGSLNTGGRYDPVSDSWTSTAIAPEGGDQTSVWTGSEVILWGGTYPETGKRYRPSTDTWTLVSTVGAPVYWGLSTSVWTGSEMIVYGACNAPPCAAGRYNPATDTWSSSTVINSGPERWSHAAVWTGSLMVVWGGYSDEVSGRPTNTGARYDPVANEWTPTSNGGMPSLLTDATSMVWTGSLAIVWGRGGGRYDPLIDTWSPISTAGSPTGRGKAVWAGARMVVLEDSMAGGRYDPVADAWSPVSGDGAPESRSSFTMVWTGSDVIVWGGSYTVGCCWNPVNSGGRYDPVMDLWVPTPAAGAPEARHLHTAVWTGSEMIIWGGTGQGGYLNSGGRYNAANNSWAPLEMTGAPANRENHAAVWTGSEMIVWGGHNVYSGQYFYDGARYDPLANTWTPTATFGAPAGTRNPKVVWTGSRMIVWGTRYDGYDRVSSGGRYDPAADLWSDISVIGAPVARFWGGHVAAWIGDSMLVWGGKDSFTVFNSGGRYLTQPGVDQDGDAFGCDSDCNDEDGQIWAPPGEATGLDFDASGLMTWLPPALPGSSMVAYDVLRSSVPGDFVAAATCAASDLGPETSFDDPAVPATGENFFYLVRARNNCPAGEGPLGYSSAGQLRTGRACPPAAAPAGGERVNRTR